jgi:thiol:disulfide interchange protein DsbD
VVDQDDREGVCDGTRRRLRRCAWGARAFRVQVLSAKGGGGVTPVHARFTADGEAVRMPMPADPTSSSAARARGVALAMALALPAGAAGAPIAAADGDARLQPAQHARVALLADHASVRPGQRLLAGLRIVHDAGWHTYWVNSGDSGLATRYDWRLPDGASAGGIRWPFPERLPFGPLTNFGYGGSLLLPAELQVPATLREGDTFQVALRARWLICADTCIPDEATLSLALPVAGDARPSPDAAAFAATLARVPTPLPGVRGHAWRDATHVAAQVDGADFARDAARIDVFPLTPQVVASTPIEARLGRDGALRFRHPASDAFDRMPAQVAWAVGIHGRDGGFRAFEITVPGDDARAH